MKEINKKRKISGREIKKKEKGIEKGKSIKYRWTENI